MIERNMLLVDATTRTEWCRLNEPRMTEWLNRRVALLPSSALCQVWLPREAYVDMTEGFTAFDPSIAGLCGGLRAVVVFRPYDDPDAVEDDGGLNFVLSSFGAESFAREVARTLRAKWQEFEAACERADTEGRAAVAAGAGAEGAWGTHATNVLRAGDKLQWEVANCLQQQIDSRASYYAPVGGQ